MPTPLIYPPTIDALQKTLDADLLTGVTASATLNNVTGVQNKKGVMVIDRVDGNNNLTPNKREYIGFDGTSGVTTTTLTRGLGGSTDQDHSVGAIVEFINDVVQQQAILDGLLTVITTAGILDTTKVADLDTAQAYTNKTLTDPTNNVMAKSLKSATTTVDVSASTAPSANQVLTATDSTHATWQAVPGTLSSKVITLTRDLTTATGDVAYTGAGFTPTSLKAFGVVDGTAFVSEGFSDSAKTSQCMYQYGSNTWSMSAGLLAMSPTISAYQIATVKSYDADGFTLTWTKTSTPTGTATVRVICYK